MFEINRRFKNFDRRAFIKVGGLSLFGTFSMGDLLRLRAEAPLPAQKDLSVILVWLSGGISHLDSFDPKPTAPASSRGPFKTIPTRLPGVHLSEHLSKLAQCTDKYVLMRSLTSKVVDHGAASTLIFSGHPGLPTLQFGSIGSVLSKELGPRNEMPPYISIPGPTGPWEGAGFLGAKYDPFKTGDPGVEHFKVLDLDLPMGVDWARMDRRHSLQALVNERFRRFDSTGAMDAVLSYEQSALNLIASARAKEAFDLEKEPEKLRDAYGRNSLGQGCLLARRLVAAGVRMVSVSLGSNVWDHHTECFSNLERMLPQLDGALAMLLNDLFERGMLDSTLVLVTGEFGRTPEVNSEAGRDHWSNAFSGIIAGGGIQGGRVLGSSDDKGMLVKDDPIQIPDLLATIYAKLGVDYTKKYMSDIGRPIRLLDEGVKPVAALA